MLKYRSAMATIFFVLSNMRAAINEKLLEAEVPVRIVHFSASVRAIFFRVEERLGKNAFAFTSFFRFCSFVVTSFVNHVIPSVYVLIINVHAVMLDFLDYNVKMQCIYYDFFYFNVTEMYRFYNYCNLSK